MLAPELVEQERAGYSLLASCFSDTSDRGGLFLIRSSGVRQLDSTHTTGIYADNQELVRLLRARDQAMDCTVRFYRSDSAPIVGLKDGHDVLKFGPTYAAASASTNSIVFFNAGGAVSRRIIYPGDRDAWHVNSLLIKDERLLASAFGRFSQHREWDSEARSKAGVVFDVETGETLVTGLSCPHHPRVRAGGWVVCDSGEGALAEVSSSGDMTRVLHLGGWTRGLAVSDSFLFVGVTPTRHANSASASARIAIVSRAEWREIAGVELPADEIYDLTFVKTSLLAQAVPDAVQNGGADGIVT